MLHSVSSIRRVAFLLFQRLARYAEEHVDDMEAPLFLRFINLLINDAIYLLDEALSVIPSSQNFWLRTSSCILWNIV